MRNNIFKFFTFCIALFLCLIIYLTYLQLFKSYQFNNSSFNPRNIEVLSKRGIMYSDNNKILAQSQLVTDIKNNEPSEPYFKRIYPCKESLAQTIGYDSLIYGKSGLEESLDSFLKFDSKISNWNSLKEYLFYGKKLAGDNATLTLNSELSNLAYDLLKKYKGAVVAINPATGEVLALVSSPSYDPNELEKNWQKISSNLDKVLLNRAIQGLYPPGSTFKLFTLSAGLDSGLIDKSFSTKCKGAYKLGDYTIHEAHSTAHGTVDYRRALIYSCNIAFAQMGLKMGGDVFYKYAEKFGLLDKVDFILPVSQARFSSKSDLEGGILAQSSFGQGEIAITPFQMALLAQAIANNGKIMKPYIIKEVKDSSGRIIFTSKPTVWLNPIESTTADEIKKIMIDVVQMGTGTMARISNIVVAGKTGTAENPHGEPHAWFIGFAPAEKPEILVCVLVENGGYGGAVSAPIARDVIEYYLKNVKRKA